MNENASGEVYTQTQTEPDQQTPQANTDFSGELPPKNRTNKLKYLALVIPLVVSIFVAVFIFTKLVSRGEEATTKTEEQSSSNETADTKIYLDSDNRFKFVYPSDVEVQANDNDIKIRNSKGELMVMDTQKLTQGSVNDELKEKQKEVGSNEIAEITKIGSRAGYKFVHENTTYMIFPLGDDSVLNIKFASSADLVNDIIQSIEFLPGVKTS